MNQISLQVKRRQPGKQLAKAARREGNVPGVFYIKNEEPVPFVVDGKELKPIVFTRETRIVNLSIEGVEETKECILKDVTFDPVTDHITHVDLFGITRGTVMQFEVPIALVGSSIGAREGGLVQHVLHRALISCMPKNLPGSIEVDISEVKIGQTIYLKDIILENVEFVTSPDTPIVSVVTPRVSKDSDVEVEGGEGEEGEEATEGESEE